MTARAVGILAALSLALFFSVGFEDCPDLEIDPLPVCEPAVPDDHALHARWEAPGFDNTCVTDADCMASGCSGEVCAAEAVASTCEVIELPPGDCGCVDGECVWNECL